MISRRTLVLSALSAAAMSQAGRAHAAPNADWRRISAEGLPGRRWDHSLSAHGKRKELVVAFGRDDAGTPLGDCWTADRSTGEWAPLSAAGPSPRFGHAVTSDASTGLIYLFGGEQGDQFFSDLWVLDLDAGAWELLAESGDVNGPSPRYGTSLVLDEDGGLYLSHGFTLEGRFDDTWRFDLTTGRWEDYSPAPEKRPLRRCLHEAAWDRSSQTMWLYGGCSSGFGPCPQGDLWQFDPGTGAWSELAVAGPDGRSNPSLVTGSDDELLLFGGMTAAGAVNDLWVGARSEAGVAWELAPVAPDGPAPRSSHDAVLSGGALYLFGGLGQAGALGDLWRLKLDAAS
jgi:hypothetical protein